MKRNILLTITLALVLSVSQLILFNWLTTRPGAAPLSVAAAQQAQTPTPTLAPSGDISAVGLLEVPPVATPGGELPGAPAIELVQVAEGFADPVNVVSPPDGSGRLFVVERVGRIRIIENGEVVEEPFLDLTGQTLSAFLEQGLYDLAFHPDYATNGRFYIHFAELLRNGDSMIVEYQVSADDPNTADPESARAILQIDQPWANHNGGELEFGPDGLLYIGSGDGGWEGDPLEAGQDLSTLLGKILRIDVDVQSPGMAYGIPEENPFAENVQLVELFGITEEEFARIHTQARPEILHYGLRNPWKFSFDPETGDLWLPDVGQNVWEEINYLPADAPAPINFGWDFLMGSHCFPIQAASCPTVGLLPVAEYSHENGDCAVIDVGVWRDEALGELERLYLASDFCSGRIWGIARAAEAAEGEAQWVMQELLDTQLSITGSGEDQDGNLYVTSCECAYGQQQIPETGAVWQVVPADEVPEGAVTAPSEAAVPVTAETPTPTPAVEATPEGTPTPTAPAEATPAAAETPTPMAAGEVTLAEVVATPAAFTGQQVTVRGEVSEAISRQAFRITDEGEELAVLTERELRRDLEQGETLRVTGTVQQFDAGLADEVGVELPGDLAEELAGQPVIVATGVRALAGPPTRPTPSPEEPAATPSPTATRPSAGTPTPTAAEEQEEVRIELSAENIAFSQDTIRVPAGARVVVEFTNRDAVSHNWAAYETDAAEEAIFVGEIITGPGETVTYEFDAPSEPGTYFFRCDVHPLAMTGDFIVE